MLVCGYVCLQLEEGSTEIVLGLCGIGTLSNDDAKLLYRGAEIAFLSQSNAQILACLRKAGLDVKSGAKFAFGSREISALKCRHTRLVMSPGFGCNGLRLGNRHQERNGHKKG